MIAGPSIAIEWNDDGNDDLLYALADGLESAALCGNTGTIFQFNLSDFN